MTVPKNKPGSFRFSFPETIFSPGSPEISPDFSHFFPNNSVPIPISIARLTKNRPPYQPYSQQWPVSVTDACTSRRCQTPRRNMRLKSDALRFRKWPMDASKSAFQRESNMLYACCSSPLILPTNTITTGTELSSSDGFIKFNTTPKRKLPMKK